MFISHSWKFQTTSMIAPPEKLMKKPPKEIFDHWKKTLGNSINGKRFVNRLNVSCRLKITF